MPLARGAFKQVEPAVGPAACDDFFQAVVIDIGNCNILAGECLRHCGNDFAVPSLAQCGQVFELFGVADIPCDAEGYQEPDKTTHRCSDLVVVLRRVWPENWIPDSWPVANFIGFSVNRPPGTLKNCVVLCDGLPCCVGYHLPRCVCPGGHHDHKA